ncbi:exonuclease SbcCD subunit D C-terminal domain-containing protein [Rhodanobacter soli]|uniref:exonuclease SbcCD subunit D C-terminal domain-containing protein n=1 Tax=Rhodanobacter soli TaxID=590609 RepID=UPI0031D5149C
MRLLHTSDWHLGQNFKGYDRHAEHRAFMDWLLDLLAQRQIDALLISGDIFDQANPSAEAQRLFYGFLAQARARCTALDIVVIAGNHDSAARIEAPHPILLGLGVHVVGQFNARLPLDEEMLQRLCIPLHRADGGVGAWALAVPFLRAGDLASAQGDSYGAGIAETYRRIVDAAAERRQPDQALVGMGHLHVQGASVSSDSERRLVIGGEEALDAGIFPAELTYVALGHLHKPQTLGEGRLRYCGSPLPLSYSEIDYLHQVVEIELGGATVISTKAHLIPRPALILRVPAKPLPLDEALAELRELTVDDAPEGLEPLIEVQILASLAPTDMRARVDEALAGKKIRLTGITRTSPQPATASADETTSPRLAMEDLQPERLFQRLLDEHPGIDNPDELHAAFAELLQGAYEEDA